LIHRRRMFCQGPIESDQFPVGIRNNSEFRSQCEEKAGRSCEDLDVASANLRYMRSDLRQGSFLAPSPSQHRLKRLKLLEECRTHATLTRAQCKMVQPLGRKPVAGPRARPRPKARRLHHEVTGDLIGVPDSPLLGIVEACDRAAGLNVANLSETVCTGTPHRYLVAYFELHEER
jgi:hypothetical protein